jgi:hypothetical protein
VVLHYGSGGRDPVSGYMRFERQRPNQCVRVDKGCLQAIGVLVAAL